MLKQGDNSKEVKELQRLLNAAGIPCAVDGDFGAKTDIAVRKFQKQKGLVVDGLVGSSTMNALRSSKGSAPLFPLYIEELYPNKDNFIAFIGGGHGGVDDSGKYTTAGKKAYHEGLELHDNGWYYEGYENRIIAEGLAAALTSRGINVVRVHHPFQDNSLNSRPEKIRAYLNRGYCGYYMSFHSNAISQTQNSAYKLKNTRGVGIYTTRGENFSDVVANKHMEHLEAEFAKDGWPMRKKKDEGEKVMDGDRESNFAVLRKSDMDQFSEVFGAGLEEFGFHTSSLDCTFITDNKTRLRRIDCAMKTFIYARSLLLKK